MIFKHCFKWKHFIIICKYCANLDTMSSNYLKKPRKCLKYNLNLQFPQIMYHIPKSFDVGQSIIQNSTSTEYV